MKFTITCLIFLFSFLILNLTFNIPPAFAVKDPLSVPNNRVGVHILEPGEVSQASVMVNSHGGNWGYVTIPMRIDDRDREKWIKFFIECRQNKIIPIIRIATFNVGDTWVAPTIYDLVDFANFLNDMPWPVKNRYVIIFNEPNHATEWGGSVSPSGYASILTAAKEIFKSRSDDFYILNAGLDMSVPTSNSSLDALQYYRQMTRFNPNWFSSIDGFSVHAYPNPGFIASPYSNSRYGITSYRYELNLLKSWGFVPKSIFITETGYIGKEEFFQPAFSTVWFENNIVAITPFVLFAGAGDFVPFSLTDSSRQPKSSYLDIYNLNKVSGSPLLNPVNAELENIYSYPSADIPSPQKNNFMDKIKNFFFPPSPQLKIGNLTIPVEIADTPVSRSKGLSNRNSLPENSGMLFIFPEVLVEAFWMKDMNFPLDFIWINNHKIVNLTENILPPGQTAGNPVIISSIFPVNEVLEVNAGFIKNHSLQIGDPVMLNSP